LCFAPRVELCLSRCIKQMYIVWLRNCKLTGQFNAILVPQFVKCSMHNPVGGP
jgi:hypothetical protein